MLRPVKLARPSVLFALLGLFASASGCGGCESCLGGGLRPSDDAAAEPEPEESPTPRSVVDAKAPVDAAAEDRDARARGDGGDAAALTREDIPAMPSLPRPKAPMPMGGFQSCGVFDAPLCKKDCPKGNCRQECDGVSCELTCKAGWCSQLCGPNAKCAMTCAGGHCVQVCTNADDCTKDCAGGDCS
jgi:hypothetical protein